MTRVLVSRKHKWHALVSKKDLNKIRSHKWYSFVETRTTTRLVYAYTFIPSHNGKRKLLYMHRYLLGLKHGDIRIVDHKNGNGLDNRRSNLRIATQSQNHQNQRKSPIRHLPKGVFIVGGGKKYGARIGVNRRHKHIGVFDTPEEAGRAYDAKAKELYGSFAALNYPQK